MPTRIRICRLLLVALGSGTSLAQTPHGHPAEASASSSLLPGMGSHDHPIATRNPQAQRFFDQGLVLGFGFNHDEAARSFRRAMELDPQAAMPCWGLTWALGPRYALAALTPGSDTFLDIDLSREKAAFEAVQKAIRLSPTQLFGWTGQYRSGVARTKYAGNGQVKRVRRRVCV